MKTIELYFKKNFKKYNIKKDFTSFEKILNKPNMFKINLIGANLKILKSNCTHYANLEGKIIKETKNSFIVYQNEQTKIVLKKNNTFLIQKEGLKFIINGDDISKTLSERIKNLKK